MTAPRPKLCIYLCLAIVSSHIAGCNRDDSEINVYKVAKATPSPTGPTRQMPANVAAAQPPPKQDSPVRIIGSTPPEWQAQPASQMRQASFLVSGEDEAQADISLVILGGAAGGDLDNVNRWRNQLGQPPISQEELEKSAETLSTAIGEGFLIDIEGAGSGDSKNDGRIVAAVLRRGDETWFFRMRGNADLARNQKDAFRRWIESVRLEGAAQPTNAAATEPAPAEVPPIVWTLPASWTPAAPKPMRFASFSATGPSGDTADISVSTFPGDTGGDLLNVNRWLNQLGLSPVNEKELESLISSIESVELPLKFVDLRNNGNRMLVAWTMHDGQSWFFKMSGSEETLEAEKSNFEAFVKSLHFHHH